MITFSEAVVVGSGNITIKKTDGDTTAETIAVGSGFVSGSGTTTITINPSVTLDSGTSYYVLIDATGFDDTAGNSYAGISSTTAWNFTTSSPSSGSSPAAVGNSGTIFVAPPVGIPTGTPVPPPTNPPAPS